MTYWRISPKLHPDIHGEYDADEDIIDIWLGSKRTVETINRLLAHETMHMVLDSIVCDTTVEQDHFIIDYLEAGGDL